MSRTCPASWFDDHSALMTSPQNDIARSSGAINRYPYSLLRSPNTLCATAHPAKDFLLSQHGEISRAKRAKGWKVSEILTSSYPSNCGYSHPESGHRKFAFRSIYSSPTVADTSDKQRPTLSDQSASRKADSQRKNSDAAEGHL